MKIKFTIMLVFLFFSTLVQAGFITYDQVTSGSRSKTETNLYAGLNWELGSGATPALVLGAFRTKVESDGDTSGGKLAFHVNLKDGVKPGKLKLSYLNGKENIQGELGAGYDFLKAEPFFGLGLNAPHIAAGVNGYMGPVFVPYIQLHTQGKFDKPSFKTSCVAAGGSGAFSDPNCSMPLMMVP